jgi:phage shock protein C
MEKHRIARNRQERVIAGVAGGLALAMKVDPMLVRLGFIVLSMVNGIGVVLYIIMWVLVPNENSSAPDTRSQVQENIVDMQSTVQQFVLWVQSLLKK